MGAVDLLRLYRDEPAETLDAIEDFLFVLQDPDVIARKEAESVIRAEHDALRKRK